MSPTPARVELVDLPVDHLHPDPDQPRRDLGPVDDLDALAESIREHGILEPILVTTRDDGQWTILAGHRRHTAARRADLDTVPCIVRDDLDTFDDLDRLQLQLVENLARRDLTPLEEADALARLVESGLTQRDVAARVGRNQSHISKRLALRRLPDQVRTRLAAGDIPIDAALQFTRVADHPDTQAELVDTYLDDIAGDMATVDDLRWEVDRQLEQAERDAKAAAARADLDAAGITTVDWPGGGHWHRAKARPIGAYYGYLWPNRKPPTKATLEKAGHLAAAVDPRDAQTVWVCTDPAAYEPVPVAGSSTSSTDPAEEERAAEAQALAEARKKRARARLEVLVPWFRELGRGHATALVIDQLRSTTTDPAFLGQVRQMFVEALPNLAAPRADVRRVVELLLDTKMPADCRFYGEWLASLPDPLLAAMAHHAATGEAHAIGADGWYVDEVVRDRHYRFLVELGYEPSDEEYELLGWDKPTAKPRGRKKAS